MVYLLFISLIILEIICLIFNKKDYSSPAIAFVSGFLFQSMWVLLYWKKWSLNLHFNTFLTITLGALEFIFVTQIVKKIMSNKTFKKDEGEINFIKVDTVIEILYLIFVILGSILYTITIVNAVGGSFNNIQSILYAIAKYDSLLKFSDNFEIVKIPFIINNIRTTIIISSYWFLYVIINNYMYNKSFKPIEMIILILTLIASILDGSRTNAVMILISGIIYFFIIYSKINKYNTKTLIKQISIVCIIGITFLSTFMAFAKALGRNITENTMDYLSIYCGAEVKNLDTFLQEDYIKSNKLWGSQTFISFISTYGQKIGFKGYKQYRLDLPFREVNGINLGNVYTTYYPYIYDFGYIGAIILIIIMASISQIIYECIKRTQLNNKPNILILSYGVIFNCLLFSFFSNKFYENIFSMDFIKKIIIWYLLNYFFCEFKFKKKNKKKD